MSLKVIREDSRYLWALCPSHNDVHTPNLCINKTEINGKPKGYGYCYACGYRIDVSPEEIDKMSKRKTICRKTIPIDWKQLNWEYQTRTFISGKYHELEKQWNVHCLFKYGIGYDDESHTFPMRREDGAIIGILRRFPDGRKICIGGSQLGLFMPNKPITQVVVVEGISDAAVATECGFWGIGLPSAAFGEKIVKKFLTLQKHYGIIRIVPDRDEAGEKSKEKLLKELSEWESFGKTVVVNVSPYNDLKEYYLSEGREQTVKLLGG